MLPVKQWYLLNTFGEIDFVRQCNIKISIKFHNKIVDQLLENYDEEPPKKKQKRKK